MPTVETVKKLSKLMKKLRPNLLAAGLTEVQIDKFTSKVDTVTDIVVNKYIEDVTALTVAGGAYHGFMGIYGLKPVTWWENMKMLGQTDLREHKILRTESNKLKAAWKELHRDGKTKAKSDVVEGTSEAVSL